MGKIAGFHAPKVLLNFIVGQMTGFISSKTFKKRVSGFLTETVDDVIDLAYRNTKK
ncbi:hypothetical protein [Companilactobacillus kimchiensis]|uniref:Uncharacterized protein n=1 Tax=Companilactobacillus kimchiensis TaxID=993692 RepID=A0A0R2LFR7_9LACO|nr:hypothetical protein [Companilactobacillus kimchiensis]KRO00311.1 hypothetical protein IV57_GL001413 [Companilactobacillus kimchiensis]